MNVASVRSCAPTQFTARRLSGVSCQDRGSNVRRGQQAPEWAQIGSSALNGVAWAWLIMYFDNPVMLSSSVVAEIEVSTEVEPEKILPPWPGYVIREAS